MFHQSWDGNGSLVAFVVSLNLQRRHLNSSQKAFVALEVERLLAVEARERQREAQIEAGKNFGRGMNRDDRSNQNFDFTYSDETESMFDDPEPPPVNHQQKPAVILDVEKREANKNKASEQAAKLTGTNRQYVADAKSIHSSFRSRNF